MLLWTSPSIHSYEESLAIIRSEREKPMEKVGPLPPPEMVDSRYVEAWHYSEKQILESSERWLEDMFTIHRWRKWVEGDEFERIRNDKGKQKRDRRISDAELAAMKADNPSYAGVPDAAIRHLHGDKKRRR